MAMLAAIPMILAKALFCLAVACFVAVVVAVAARALLMRNGGR